MTEIRKVAEDSPDRCHGNSARGQCPNGKMPGSDFCKVHGGVDKVAKESKRNYMFTKVKFQQQVDEKAGSDNIKCLREEIGLVRLILEMTINRCKDDTDLLLESAKISDMVGRIDGLVKSCHKLEGSMGNLLDKQAVLQFAGQVIGIIANNIKDETLLNTIADEIANAIGDNNEQ